jgi:hypothetical protein
LGVIISYTFCEEDVTSHMMLCAHMNHHARAELDI